MTGDLEYLEDLQRVVEENGLTMGYFSDLDFPDGWRWVNRVDGFAVKDPEDNLIKLMKGYSDWSFMTPNKVLWSGFDGEKDEAVIKALGTIKRLVELKHEMSEIVDPSTDVYDFDDESGLFLHVLDELKDGDDPPTSLIEKAFDLWREEHDIGMVERIWS